MGNYPIPIMIILIVKVSLVCVDSNNVAAEGIKCSGYCTKDPQRCKARGGRIMGSCTNSLACCDPMIASRASCGDTTAGQRLIHLKSPDYPAYSKGDLTCQVKIKIRNDTAAIRVDFVQAEMDGQSFIDGQDESGSCESDMIFFRGFMTWAPPPRCGNLSGYSFLIDRESPQAKDIETLSLLALMSSPAYRWHIMVLQVPQKKTHYYGENSIEDYEVPFKWKRSLLTPYTRTKEKNEDNAEQRILSDGEDLISSPSSLSPPEYEDSMQASEDIPLILNGEDSVISLVPWQVSLRIKTDEVAKYVSNVTVESSKSGGNRLEGNTNNCSKSEGFHFCGGSIIGNRYVLSAAHCFHGLSKTNGMMNISSIKAVLGDTNVCTDESTRAENDLRSYDYEVESIVLHYGFDSQLLINDIALVRLKKVIKTFGHIKPIRMAQKGDTFIGKEALLSGWGDTDPLSGSNSSSFDSLDSLDLDDIIDDLLESPDILQASRKLIIQNQTFCNSKDLEEYSDSQENIKRHHKYLFIFDSTICTVSKIENETDRPVSAGKGDSGGPLVVNDEGGNPVLVGVVSYGIAEESNTCKKIVDEEEEEALNKTLPMDFFASVAFYRNWIDLAMKSYDENQR